MKTIDLDHAATTVLDERVLEAMVAVWRSDVANPNSVHHRGRRARALWIEATHQLAEAVGCASEEVVWTSGGTESNNTALFGVMSVATRHCMVSTAVEHSSVLRPLQQLIQRGYECKAMPVDATGKVRALVWNDMIDEQTALVTVNVCNHEVGTIQDVIAIGARARACGAVMHVDAAQSFGHVALQWSDAPIDMMSLSAHKFHGPVGIGALIVRHGVRWAPLLYGGEGQQRGRPGTPPVALAVGMAQAAQYAVQQQEAWQRHVIRLRRTFLQTLEAQLSGDVWFIQGDPQGSPHILSLAFPGINADVLLMRLDLIGVAVSRGAACSAGVAQPSSVLQAMGVATERMAGTIRIGFGWTNCEEDVAYAGRCITEIVRALRES